MLTRDKSESTSSSLMIKDIMILSNKQGKFKINGERITDNEINELCQSIQGLVNIAKKNQSTQPNTITRLITNEFSFFTTFPLKLEEFQQVQQFATNLVKDSPNMHLILASFAVRTDDKMMNVTSHIQGGDKPKVDFIVKNNVAIGTGFESDIFYNKFPDYLTKKNIGSQNLPTIEIDEQPCQFSFNNVIQCTPKEGTNYFSCVDVCLDHGEGIALENLKKKIQECFDKKEYESLIKGECAHVVTSNTIHLEENKCIVSIEEVTHADHINSKIRLNKEKDSYEVKQDIEFPLFYERPAKPTKFWKPAESQLIIKPERPCTLLLTCKNENIKELISQAQLSYQLVTIKQQLEEFSPKSVTNEISNSISEQQPTILYSQTSPQLDNQVNQSLDDKKDEEKTEQVVQTDHSILKKDTDKKKFST